MKHFMINEEKIKIYRRYEGDIDGWARTANKQEKKIMEDSDWYLIEALIQDIKLLKKGLVSNDYSNSVTEKLNSNCDSIETIEKLKALTEDSEATDRDGFFNKIRNIFKSKK